MDKITRLFPQPIQDLPLKGAYLEHDLRQFAKTTGKTFVYSNFVASIDGRIAIPHPSGKGLMVPKMIANERDWRLYQELAVQADLIISSGRYLHDWADGRAQEILQVEDSRFAELRDWRQAQGLRPQPDIAVISGSLRFPIPEVLTANGRKVIVFTSAIADPERVKEIESQAGQVIVAGQTRVDSALVVKHMNDRGYQTVFSSAGPKILHLLLASNALNRLYLTHANRLLGGQTYSSIVEGPLFDPALDLKLNTIYLDPYGLDGVGQVLISYDCL